MNSLELKGGILQMIASIEDQKLLEEINNLVTNFVDKQNNYEDYDNELSDLERMELQKAIEESKDKGNLVPHEEMMKKYAKWLYK